MIGLPIALIPLLAAALGFSESPVAMLDLGTYEGGDLPRDARAGEWLALCPTSTGAELKPVIVKIDAHSSELREDRPSEKTGREVTAPGWPKAYALRRSRLFRAPLMSLRRIMSWSARLCLAGSRLWCGCDRNRTKGAKLTPSRTVEILPGKSIGEIRIGANIRDLPARATIRRPGGELDQIHFLVNEADEVEDVWIEDLRTFPLRIRLQGQEIPPGASIEDFEALFGKCERISGIKGGIFWNCLAGVALGTDFSRKTLQIRVKSISKAR